jgi:hypothetical protein
MIKRITELLLIVSLGLLTGRILGEIILEFGDFSMHNIPQVIILILTIVGMGYGVTIAAKVINNIFHDIYERKNNNRSRN